MCHFDYRECRDFAFEMWIKGDVTVGSETQLLAEVVVRDGNKIIVGNMTMGKLIPEPTGSSPELDKYRRAFGSSVSWLSAYATTNIDESQKGPKGVCPSNKKCHPMCQDVKDTIGARNPSASTVQHRRSPTTHKIPQIQDAVRRLR